MADPRLNAAQPVVSEDGTMEQPFREWTILVSDTVPVVGAGSPEGVLEAPQFSLYIDSAGSTGSIEYRKMLTDIAGDRSAGWVLV